MVVAKAGNVRVRIAVGESNAAAGLS